MPRTISTGRVDPLLGYRYQIRLGSTTVGFSNVSGLKEESDTAEYREGHEISTVHKMPGIVSYDDVSFERGMTAGGKDELLEWRRDVISLGDRRNIVTSPGEGAPSGSIYRNVEIRVFTREGTVGRIITLKNAHPKSLEVSDLAADSSDVLIQTMVLAHEGMEISEPTDGRSEII